jgi:hypothetical protein
MKKIVYVVLLLLVLGGEGFFIYSRNKSDNSPTREYGILNPNPNQPAFGQPENQSEQNTQPTPVAEAPKPTPTTTTKPKGAVLGETKPAPKPAPTPTKTASPTPSVNAGLNVYRITELGFQISTPPTWLPRLEEAGGNVVAFYNSSGGQLGQIEVLVDARESFEALTAEIQANPNISNVQSVTVNGQAALMFNDQRFGGGKVIAMVHGNNVYYLRGAFATSPELQNFKFIN